MPFPQDLCWIAFGLVKFNFQRTCRYVIKNKKVVLSIQSRGNTSYTVKNPKHIVKPLLMN